MKKKILINARYPQEKRVAIIEGDALIDFYVEVSSREHLKGNIYKGVVTRIEPSIQAVFVDFGQKKPGFLQKKEIKPDYFKRGTKERSTKIQSQVSKGQELIVQVEKDERGTKGATLTTFISLPGRYVVMMPGKERIGVSRKIEGKEDRERLKKIFSALKLPKKMGFILRTACGNHTKNELSNDLKYLTKLWEKIQTEARKVAAPALIYREHDIAVRTVRDYLTADISGVFIDDYDAYRNTREFLRRTVPWRRIPVRHYKEEKPIFTKYNIEGQISKISERYVHLQSRGYLVIDRTEAVTAIDVNSGKSKAEDSVESTALKTNLEAADEIARQLRLRDIGGLIIVDFIDMSFSKNRKEVEKRLDHALSSDKAHIETTGISKFGILEMTRERMRPAYSESVYKSCEVCGGTGTVKTDEMVAIAALRDIHVKASKGESKSIHCVLPVQSANYLINEKRYEISLLEDVFKVKISITVDSTLLPGQFHIEMKK